MGYVQYFLVDFKGQLEQFRGLYVREDNLCNLGSESLGSHSRVKLWSNIDQLS